MSTNQPTTPRWLPALDWLRAYDHSWLRGDVVAGITLAAERCSMPDQSSGIAVRIWGDRLFAGDSQSWALWLPGCVLQAFPRLFRFERFCQAVR
jgi:hypothetical protein